MTPMASRVLSCWDISWPVSSVPIRATQATSANQISRLTRRRTYGVVVY